jgi:hypothetical protein
MFKIKKKKNNMDNVLMAIPANSSGKIKHFFDFETQKVYIWEDGITPEQFESFMKKLDSLCES